MPIREVTHARPGVSGGFITFHAWATFFVLLAGQFTLERLTDGDMVLPVPERLVLAVCVYVLGLPAAGAARIRAITLNFIYLMLFMFWAWVSVFRGIWDEYSAAGAVDIAAMTLLVASVYLVAANDPGVYATALLKATLYAGFIFAGAGMLASTGERFSAFGGGPNVFARITGTAVIAGVFLVLERKVSPFMIAGVPVALAASVLSGSRGGMLGLASAVLVVTVAGGLKGRGFAALAVFGVVMVGVAVFWDRIYEVIAVRWIDLTFGQGYSSGREDLLGPAVEMFAEKPIFGWGLESWASNYAVLTGQGYPHNLLIQVAAELGIIGLLLLAGVLWTWWRGVPFGFARRMPVVINSLVVYYFVAAQFSGDYYDSRHLFVLIPLSLLVRQADFETRGGAGNRPAPAHLRGSKVVRRW